MAIRKQTKIDSIDSKTLACFDREIKTPRMGLFDTNKMTIIGFFICTSTMEDILCYRPKLKATIRDNDVTIVDILIPTVVSKSHKLYTLDWCVHNNLSFLCKKLLFI